SNIDASVDDSNAVAAAQAFFEIPERAPEEGEKQDPARARSHLLHNAVKVFPESLVLRIHGTEGAAGIPHAAEEPLLLGTLALIPIALREVDIAELGVVRLCKPAIGLPEEAVAHGGQAAC